MFDDSVLYLILAELTQIRCELSEIKRQLQDSNDGNYHVVYSEGGYPLTYTYDPVIVKGPDCSVGDSNV